MKKILFPLLFAVFIYCIASVPDDRVILQRVTRHYTGENPVGEWLDSSGISASVGSELYQVHDYIFFKTCTNNITGVVVARAYFGSVQFL